MEPTTFPWALILDQLGGGVLSVAVLALGFAYREERKRNQHINDARIADGKEHASQLLEGIRALDKTSQALETANAILVEKVRTAS